MSNGEATSPESIAVIGMAGRFPGAPDPAAFWRVLMDGVDAVEKFDPSTLEYSCATPEDLAAGRRFVSARGTLPDVDKFDAAFFGIYPKEAELMDPQHRVFLECAWEALESAGHDPARYPGLIGVYAGVSLNTYLLWNLARGRLLAGNYQVGEYQTMLGNDKDFLPVRVSYKLNLRGPSMGVQCACSTSLVAICQAATALMTYQCDMALAGGSSISFPQRRDYPFEPDAMVSADGKCRAFDAGANGTIFGHGCGVVLLKRLSDAVADRDPILAVIRGWAVNNDGSDKVGFAAPSVKAQADVIAMAQAAAGVRPEEVSYIEAHGTGTPLGDPIEVAGLTEAFRAGGSTGTGFCALGTGKTNVGHLDVAAGATGVIKTILQFQHEQIPPLLHYTAPNPRIDFASSPFVPVANTMPWPRGDRPRIAGVSAFGVGGTNAHVVMQEPPPRAPRAPEESGHAREVLLLSARTPSALDAMSRRLADYLESNPVVALADVAYTLAVGRHRFACRRAVAARDASDAIARLRTASSEPAMQLPAHAAEPAVVMLFPGQGAQFVGMGEALYRSEPVFRETVDECAMLLLEQLGVDLRETLFPPADKRADAEKRIHETWLTQPAIFTIELAMARLWIARGVRPAMVIGHSIGEYVAAVIAGSFSLPDAVRLLAKRARFMMDLPAGSMLAVRLPAEEVAPLLPDDVSVAAINSPKLCTVSGPTPVIHRLRTALEEKKILAKLLPTSHAFHSAMMDPMLEPFTREAATVSAQAPAIPWVSTCTAGEMTGAHLADPAYWARQIRQPVLFGAALERAFALPGALLLEVGPGQALAQFARQHPARPAALGVVASLPRQDAGDTGIEDAAVAMGQLCAWGWEPDWNEWFAGINCRRLALPTYPFERQRFWIDRSGTQVDISDADRVEESHSAEFPAQQDVSPEHLVLDEVLAILRDLSGMDRASIDPRRSFLELGFDSLFLTQASQAIQKKFLVKITLRQMLDTLSSPGAIAAHVAANRPAAQAPVATAAKPEVPAAAAAAGPFGMEEPAPTAPPARHGPFAPINKAAADDLTPRQRRALDELMARYIARTRRSKEYTQQHRSHFSDPRAVSGFRSTWKEMTYPIVSARSQGSRIWDIDGNEYIDVTMGFGTYLFGHNPEFIRTAIEKQLSTGIEIGPQNILAGELAKRLCALSGMDRVTFCTTGSEAVMGAVRAARTVTGRDQVVYFSGDYHGIHEEVLAKGLWAQGKPRTLPIAPGIPRELVSQVHVLPWGDPAGLDWIRANAASLAAVLVEPVQSRRPEYQPREFLTEVRAITKETGVALIFDEIVTGFRLDLRGAQAWYGIEADLATYGKIVGGGLPIGVIAGKRAYLDAFDGGMWRYGDDSIPEAGVTFFAGTFVRHPLAMAAAKAVLDHLEAQGPSLQRALTERTARFVESLNRYFAGEGIDLHINTCASIWYFGHGERFKHFSLLFHHLRELGIHVWEGRPCFMSTAHSEEDIARIEAAIRQAVQRMRDGGFIGEAAPVIPETGPFPLTESQQEIWLTSRLDPRAAPSFNESCAFTFKGAFDRASMETALRNLVRRHEALRTGFDSEGRHQTVSDAGAPPLRFDDLSARPAAEREASCAALIREEVATPFDLAAPPLLRARVIRLAADHHVMSLTVHHLVCDGWSYDVMTRDLAALYTMACHGSGDTRPPPVQFRDYARLMADYRADARHETDLAYWRDALAAPPPAIEWPVDKPRPPVRSFAGAMEVLPVEGALLESIKQLGARNRCTLFSTLMAVYAVLVHKLTGQRDLVIGVPAAGQQLMDGKELVGHCANLLPLRFRIEPDRPFTELLAQAQRALLEGYEHQGITFGTLLQALQMPRDPSRPPLIQATFNVDPAMHGIQFDALQADIVINPRTGYQFEHSLNIVAYADRLRMECNYNTDLFTAETIHRWLGHFLNIARALAADEKLPVGLVPLMTPEEESHLLAACNPVARPYPQHCIHDLFEEQAAGQPDRIALSFKGRTLTYGQLNERANQLARALVALGVRPDQPVGLCADRSFDLVIGLLGILKAGGAYVPLDPAHPRERLEMQIADTRLSVVVTQSAHAALFSAQKLTLDDEKAAWRGLPAGNLSSDERGAPHQPSQLAYILYTSGSTGKPKGVVVEHKSVVRLVKDVSYVRLGPDERMIHLSPLAFDASTFELWGALLNGARLAILPSGPFTLDALERLMREEQTTLLWITTGLFHTLVDERPECLATVRQVLTGGEVTSGRHIRKLLDMHPGLVVIHCYGPTESTTFTTAEPLVRDSVFGDPPPLGRPIDRTQVYVLDAQRRPCPVGVAGELCIGGDGLARGYLNRPELTAELFIPNPLSGTPGDRLYRSGDWARWRADGKLEFIGRRDDQVKIRGYRIEPGEIEAVLAAHPGVKICAVVVKPSASGEKQLVAYIVPSARGETAGAEAYRTHLLERLPAFMTPALFVVRDELPIAPNGKLDRRALPDPDMLDPRPSNTVAPSTEREQLVARLFADVLGMERIGVEDDFFALGGHSLAALKLINRLHETGYVLEVASLFRQSTVAGVASALTPLPRGAHERTGEGVVVRLTEGRPDRTPLVLLPSDFGDLLIYANLMPRLDPDQPCIGLQCPALYENDQGINSIEGLAGWFLSHLRAVQPKGPYQLAGYCFGGHVALEMARQLKAAGERVAFLGLIDARPFRPASHRGEYFLMRLLGALRARREDWKRHLAAKWAMRREGRLIDQMARTSPDRLGRRELNSWVMETRMLANYRTTDYPGTITFFFPEESQYGLYGDPSCGWLHMAERVHLFKVKGSHVNMMKEPHVSELAARLRTCLRAAREGSAT
ncbi:MAG TPA: amino acid adenylation domain-containing protein [Kiritimatiellia bacterium]|nr:amino acid adenylation domain-containing protein [Kiritimatiellia bacterium]